MAESWLRDRQAIFFGHFLKRIREIFVQFAPLLAAKEEKHILVKEHKLFRHPLFKDYAKSQMQLVTFLEQLNSLLPPLFTNTPNLGFQLTGENAAQFQFFQHVDSARNEDALRPYLEYPFWIQR